MRSSRPMTNRKSHHITGTKGFACLDGEGVKGYTSPNEVEETFCAACNYNITHRNRYWISLNGPYCRTCYYMKKGISVDTIIQDANSGKYGSFASQKYGFSDDMHITVRNKEYNDFIQ